MLLDIDPVGLVRNRRGPAGEGAEIMSGKELLGHSTLAASERYAQLSNQRVKNVYLQTMQKVIEKTQV